MHVFLTRLCIQKGVVSWQMKPKFHQYEHILLNTRTWSCWVCLTEVHFWGGSCSCYVVVRFKRLCACSMFSWCVTLGKSKDWTAGLHIPLWMRMPLVGASFWRTKWPKEKWLRSRWFDLQGYDFWPWNGGQRSWMPVQTGGHWNEKEPVRVWSVNKRE